VDGAGALALAPARARYQQLGGRREAAAAATPSLRPLTTGGARVSVARSDGGGEAEHGRRVSLGAAGVGVGGSGGGGGGGGRDGDGGAKNAGRKRGRRRRRRRLAFVVVITLAAARLIRSIVAAASSGSDRGRSAIL